MNGGRHNARAEPHPESVVDLRGSIFENVFIYLFFSDLFHVKKRLRDLQYTTLNNKEQRASFGYMYVIIF